MTRRAIDAIREVDRATSSATSRTSSSTSARRRHLPKIGDRTPASASTTTACRHGAPGSCPTTPRTLVFDNADEHAEQDRRRADATEFGATDDTREIERIVEPRRRAHGLLAVVALLRLRRPDDQRARRRPGARERPDASRRRAPTSIRASSACSRGPTRRRSPARPTSSASTRTRRLPPRLLDRAPRTARRCRRGLEDRGLRPAKSTTRTATTSQANGARSSRIRRPAPGAEARAPRPRRDRHGQPAGRRVEAPESAQ